ncbi:CDP-glucose 4,6-dehydratase [Polynucleobacter yangtzensis]|uniref:CDP-glucose 4,6-dehydratase n=1 Tax=Polynucleobacter yangtzensis TaxID=1743159 RepID=A0ABN6TV96_9BURK|nr:CDP-glucose 4,6-dehydratase [Polynucleobacter yangtzensis]BDT78451.1 CDP-glucose 4,6-dehydratase [Polynucleobacter yangtzensis]
MTLPNSQFWRGKRVLITGHTGFKGGWLSLWLQEMGAKLYGLSLAPPTSPSLFIEASVAKGMQNNEGDIRDFGTVVAAMAWAKPEIILHLAAQPLVRKSYIDPIETYSTNVMGTLHLLESARKTSSVRAFVNVTTDKCYKNREWLWGYREDEPMGGHDPYSSSKGCSELLTSAYRESFFSNSGIALASTRAGNVIGGGDWAEDRLVPDILRGFERGETVVVRNPKAIRPWQHVLEPLSGYLVLAERLYDEGSTWAEAWNFGPGDADSLPVEWILSHMASTWGEQTNFVIDQGLHPHEATYLKLDISKAKARLGWTPRWNLSMALDQIVAWHKAWMAGSNMHKYCLEEIARFKNTPVK